MTKEQDKQRILILEKLINDHQDWDIAKKLAQLSDEQWMRLVDTICFYERKKADDQRAKDNI